MVVEIRWIKGSFCLMLLLQTAAEISQLVREGDKATLTCGNTTWNPAKCEDITWILASSSRTNSQELVTLGKVNEIYQPRISLLKNCSLLIQEVQAVHAGMYSCRQYRSGHQEIFDASVYLSVVTLRTQTDMHNDSLTCCVLNYDASLHQVKWLFNNLEAKVEEASGPISQSSCSTVKVSNFHHFWKCKVIFHQMVKTFSFRPLASTTPVTVATITAEDSVTLRDFCWYFIIAAAVFMALFVIVLIVVKRKQTKAVKISNNDKQNTHSALTHSAVETNEDMVDPEDPVSYAPIIIKSQWNARGHRKNDDADGVIYTTVKPSPSDPSMFSVDI